LVCDGGDNLDLGGRGDVRDRCCGKQFGRPTLLASDIRRD
jgi:hypothetical protein